MLAGLAVRADGRYCDATFGRGGHTASILGALGPEGRVVAIDRDPDAIRAGRGASRGNRVSPATFRSRSRNTPFGGWTLRGGVAATIVGGRLVDTNEAFAL